MNTKYSFCSEVQKKYSRKIYEMFESIFEYLPLVTVVEREIFIVHGG
jgi:serine/threonine-protein phosphatase 5